jgi:hypothetical protein
MAQTASNVVHLEENFETNTVPSLNTDKAASIASMDKIRRMIATYKASLIVMPFAIAPPTARNSKGSRHE